MSEDSLVTAARQLANLAVIDPKQNYVHSVVSHVAALSPQVLEWFYEIVQNKTREQFCKKYDILPKDAAAFFDESAPDNEMRVKLIAELMNVDLTAAYRLIYPCRRQKLRNALSVSQEYVPCDRPISTAELLGELRNLRGNISVECAEVLRLNSQGITIQIDDFGLYWLAYVYVSLLFRVEYIPAKARPIVAHALSRAVSHDDVFEDLIPKIGSLYKNRFRQFANTQPPSSTSVLYGNFLTTICTNINKLLKNLCMKLRFHISRHDTAYLVNGIQTSYTVRSDSIIVGARQGQCYFDCDSLCNAKDVEMILTAALILTPIRNKKIAVASKSTEWFRALVEDRGGEFIEDRPTLPAHE